MVHTRTVRRLPRMSHESYENPLAPIKRLFQDRYVAVAVLVVAMLALTPDLPLSPDRVISSV